jgi:hypothetical protein
VKTLFTCGRAICKPWRDSSNEERLNGKNGLLLTLTIDHLFDRGLSLSGSQPDNQIPSLT